MIRIFLCLVTLLFGAFTANAQEVDTRVGTAAATTRTAGRFGKHTEEYGHTLPAVLSPHGMTFWTPQTRATERKCVCPYYSSDPLLQGIRASHWIVGGCTQDYGSFTLMPLTSRKKLRPEERALPRLKEHATPSLYDVTMPGVHAEVTGTSRTAIMRFTFDNRKHAYMAFETNSDEGAGTIIYDEENNRIIASNPVHRIYQGWGESAGMTGYVVVQLRAGDVTDHGFGPDSTLWLRFGSDNVLVKCATSFTSVEGALRNLEAEMPHWDFEMAQGELQSVWEKLFSKVEVQGEEKQKVMLRTALYHSSFLPHDISDADGAYPAFAGGGIRQDGPYYDDFSAWDTYRAQHPLLNILSPSLSSAMMQSLVMKYGQGGWLPIFPCWNSYTAAMIGDHCSAILADAYVKGIRGFDAAKAYEGMLKNAMQSPLSYDEYKNGMGRRALQSYLKYGYIPLEDSVPDAFHTHEQVSRTLEYAFDDYALSQMARHMGDADNYRLLMERSGNWRNVFDPSLLSVNGRHADGRFATEPVTYSERPSYITEGWPCHYRWYVPQDPSALITAMGGPQAFCDSLNALFTDNLYWHGNEPCHQVAYMFDYAHQPWLTQRWVRFILDTEYDLSPGGLSGNDDAGQMSAWYVFSSLGFYPVCPAATQYAIASPTFPHATLHLENGRDFTIIAHDASDKNIYIQDATLNGWPLTAPFLEHEDIMRGGTLEVWMGPDPSAWGQLKADLSPLAFGAVGDGLTDDTRAVQACIDAVAQAGGGRVTFPSGRTFLCGPLQLKGNTEYHFEQGATLLADPNESTYTMSAFGDNRGEGMLWLWAHAEDNITISGTGTIDGNGIAFMGPELEDSYVLKDLADPKFDPRPHLLTLFGCRNVDISGVTVQNGAYWTIHLVGCDGARIHDMSLLNQLKIRNGDGIDLDHTSNVDVWNCHITSGDDCVCLKNRREYSEGYLEAFTYLGNPQGLVMRSTKTQNIHVWDCTMTSRSCSIKIGSENMDSISDVLFERCAITASNRGLGIQNRDEGTVSDVTFQDMYIECRLFSDVWWGKAEPIYVTSYPRAVGNHKDAGWRFPLGAKAGKAGPVSRITFRNIHGLSENGSFLGAAEEGLVTDIILDNIDIQPQRLTDYPQGVYDRRPCLGDLFLNGEPTGVMTDKVTYELH